MEQISVNLIPPGIKGTCHASQFDIGRSIRFALLSGSNIYTLSGSETITMKIRKPDGTERTETLANTSSTYVDLVTNRDTCDQSGTYDCEITVTDGGVVIGSGNFTMEVEADSLDGIIVVKTASGAIASFETSLPFPLQEAKFTLPYRAEGYTELTHYKATSTPVKDNAPYRLRKAPSGIGNKSIEKLIGASVNFNQLINAQDGTLNGITISVNDGLISCAGTSDETYRNITVTPKIPESHKVLVALEIVSNPNNINFKLGIFNGVISFPSGATGSSRIGVINPNSRTTYSIGIEAFSAGTDFTNVKFYATVIDLTAFFGSSTIADHLYNLETETAGAGVAKFKALGFDAPYYPYTANTLMSAKPTVKKIVGKNQFPQSTVSLGGSNPRTLRIDFPQPLLIDTYTLSYIKGGTGTNYGVNLHDENGQIVGFGSANPVTRIPDRRATYAYFYMDTTDYNNGKTVELSDIMLQFGSTATAYEPHEEKMTIYSGEELRGIFELDVNNNIVANGDEDDGSGTGAVRYVEIDLSDVSDWYEGGTNTADGSTWWYTYDFQNLTDQTGVDFISDNFSNSTAVYIPAMTNHTAFFLDGALYIAVNDNDKTGKFIMPRKTPTTKSIRTWDNPQPAMAGGTEEFIDGNVYGAVDLGSLEWVYTDGGFTTQLPNNAKELNSNAEVLNCFCDIPYEVMSWNDANYYAQSGTMGTGIVRYIKVFDSNYTDAAAFKAAMSGHWLIYEKAAEGPAEMPCGHDTTYAVNLKYSKKTFAQIFGGDLDAVTGVLTSRYNSDGTQKTTPEIIQLTPEAIIALLGTNTIWNDAGETEVKFVDLKGEET